jgi:hypothetical protein
MMVDWRVLISLASWKRKRGPKTGSAVLYSAKSGLKRLPRGLQAVFIAVQEMKNKKADQSAGKARLVYLPQTRCRLYTKQGITSRRISAETSF